jgi:nitrous-oxide reductase
MPVIYDLPIGVGEPHYCQMIKADKLKSWEVYPEIGWNPHTQSSIPTRPRRARRASTATATRCSSR